MRFDIEAGKTEVIADGELRNRLAANATSGVKEFDLKIIGERLLKIISEV